MAEGFFIVRLNTGGAMAKVPHPAPPRTRPPKPALQSTNDVVPSPVEQMTGAEAVVRALEEVGTEVVFGIPGGAILPVYDPLFDSANYGTSWCAMSRAPDTRPPATLRRRGRSGCAWPPPDREPRTWSRHLPMPTWTPCRWWRSPGRWPRR